MAESGRIRLRRKRRGRDALRAYKVLVDDEQVGHIRRGQEIALEVESGPHRVRLKLDWKDSQQLDIHVSPGQEVVLICHGGRLGRAALDLFSRSRSWIELHVEDRLPE